MKKAAAYFNLFVTKHKYADRNKILVQNLKTSIDTIAQIL